MTWRWWCVFQRRRSIHLRPGIRRKDGTTPARETRSPVAFVFSSFQFNSVDSEQRSALPMNRHQTVIIIKQFKASKQSTAASKYIIISIWNADGQINAGSSIDAYNNYYRTQMKNPKIASNIVKLNKYITPNPNSLNVSRIVNHSPYDGKFICGNRNNCLKKCYFKPFSGIGNIL